MTLYDHFLWLIRCWKSYFFHYLQNQGWSSEGIFCSDPEKCLKMPWAWSKKLPGLVSTLATEKHPSGTQPKNFLWTYILWCKAKILYELWLSLFFVKKCDFGLFCHIVLKNFPKFKILFFNQKRFFFSTTYSQKTFKSWKLCACG